MESNVPSAAGLVNTPSLIPQRIPAPKRTLPAPPIMPAALEAKSFALPLTRLLYRNFRTFPKSVTIVKGLLNHRIPTIRVPNPTNPRTNPPSFSQGLDSSDRRVYNPSIVLTTPNFATSKINLAILLRPSIIFLTFSLLAGSPIHFRAGIMIAALRRAPSIFIKPSKKLPVPLASPVMTAANPLPFFFWVYSALNVFSFFLSDSNSRMFIFLISAMTLANELTVAPRLFIA